MSSSVTELTAILETVMEIHHCIGLYRYVLMECVYKLFCYGADCCILSKDRMECV